MELSPAEVRDALNAADIEGLLEAGAPADEYSGEARDIASALTQIKRDELSEETLASAVQSVWKHSFGLSDSDLRKRSIAFRQVAHRLLELRSLAAS
jgi:hypothetical protein